MKKNPIFDQFQKEVVAYYIPRGDMDRVGEMVGGAFAEDKAIQYLLGDISKKARNQYYKTTYCSMLGDAIMISTNSKLDNIIVLCPPGYRGITTMRFLCSGGIATACKVGLGTMKRSLAFEKNAVEVRKRFSDEKTWYLMTFAVRAGKMHRGLGSEILRPVLEWMDKNQYPIYLETCKAANVELYQHFGFQVMDICNVPGAKIKQYGMLRPTN